MNVDDHLTQLQREYDETGALQPAILMRSIRHLAEQIRQDEVRMDGLGSMLEALNAKVVDLAKRASVYNKEPRG